MNDDIREINNNFYVKYNPQIRVIVARILNNSNQSGDIDDCVNTVYLALMEKLQLYSETRGSMGAFVATVTRTIALNYCRDNKRKPDELIGDDKLDFINGPIKVEDDVEFHILVETIAKKLNDEENVLFTMKYIYFYSPEEIAKAFKIKRNAVDARLNRLKSKVKNYLTKGGISL
jgi:RNA polymerase sigma-70 factor (ECF subfamily)